MQGLTRAVTSGLSQFSTTDIEDDRVCSIQTVFDLAENLVTENSMTEERAEMLNDSFANLTGHYPLIEKRSISAVAAA